MVACWQGGVHLLEHDEQEVCEAVALVHLVHDQVSHPVQALGLCEHAQQDAVGAEHQAGLGARSACPAGSAFAVVVQTTHAWLHAAGIRLSVCSGFFGRLEAGPVSCEGVGHGGREACGWGGEAGI